MFLVSKNNYPLSSVMAAMVYDGMATSSWRKYWPKGQRDLARPEARRGWKPYPRKKKMKKKRKFNDHVTKKSIKKLNEQ